jgi:hypothetical protein
VVTHEVVAAGPDGYRMRIGGLEGPASRDWTADLHLRGQAGLPAGSELRFDPPVPLFQWPLRPGQTWTEVVEARGVVGARRLTGAWRVASTIEAVDAVAGRFYTLRVEEVGGDGRRLAAYWYTPLVRYWVRFESYVDGYTEELLDFRPWQS